MKQIADLFKEAQINEGRPAGSKNKPKNQDNPNVNPDLEELKGKDPEKNGTDGCWAIDEPTDDDVKQGSKYDKATLNRNMKRLLMKFRAKEDFFIIGEAGWGKTSIIKSMAKRFGRSVITVYLDKAVSTDLGGIPVPVKGKSGAVQENAMPGWGKIIEDNPDKQFLLFFDEMNQAAPDVMNALMPIVLEHEICNRRFKNFIVGAAGNFEYENGAVSELSGPLRSRFKPIITWETGGANWKQAFDHMHKEWDKVLRKELIDEIEKNAEIFENPREIEHKVLKFIANLKASGDYEEFDPEDFVDRIEGLVKDDLSRTQQNSVTELGQLLYDYVNDKLESQKKSGRSASRDVEMLPDNVKKALLQAMTKGYIEDSGVKYGFSRENIYTACDDACNAEMVERYINKLIDDGKQFKFETNDEFKKAGYTDPDED